MNLALFDFDGTITTREMFADFLDFAVPGLRLRVGKVLLAPLVMAYKAGLVSAVSTRACVVQVAFRGADQTRLEQLGERFAMQQLPAVVRPDVMQRIDWHRACGDRVVVVSGAFDLYLRHWCQTQQLELLCSSLQMHAGRCTGRYQGAQCAGPEKARRIRELCRLEDYPVVYAYGDTQEDLDMLALAHQRVYRGQLLN